MGTKSKKSRGFAQKNHSKERKEEKERDDKRVEDPIQDMGLDAVDQSRLPSPHKAPWLVYFSHGKRRRSHTFFSIPEGRCYVRNMPELRRRHCVASFQGWLFMKDCKMEDCLLINPLSMKKIHLPSLPKNISDFSHSRSECILTAPPTDPHCVVLFVDHYKPIIVYWRLLHCKWEIMKYKTGEDGGLCISVACSGKVYGVTYDNMKLVVIDFNPNPKVIVMESVTPSTFPFRTPSSARYLVESCGEVFLICMFYVGRLDVVHTIEVYRLDLMEMKMVGVESIGDRAFFLSSYSYLSCSASESGVRRDCIYYVQPDDPTLYRFDLADKSIAMDLPCPNLSTPWSEPHWILPSS